MNSLHKLLIQNFFGGGYWDKNGILKKHSKSHIHRNNLPAFCLKCSFAGLNEEVVSFLLILHNRNSILVDLIYYTQIFNPPNKTEILTTIPKACTLWHLIGCLTHIYIHSMVLFKVSSNRFLILLFWYPWREMNILSQLI